MCTNACRRKGKPAKTLPADGIGYIPVARGHREGFSDCDSAIEHILVTRWLGGERRRKRVMYMRTCRKQVTKSVHKATGIWEL